MQKKKKTTKKKDSITSIKKRAWKYFSEFIRLRDSDANGYGKCITCGQEHFWKNAQAGHLIGGRHNAVLFNEEIVHLQCIACNCFKGGKYIEYFLEMERRVGREKLDELMKLKNATVKYTKSNYIEIYKKYLHLSTELKREKGLNE